MSAISSGQSTNGNGSKDLFTLVIATIPAVLLYFVGWAYLYFYLRAFGIGISELDLDAHTILIYAFPPIRMMLGSWWHWLLIAVSAIPVVVWLVRRFAPQDVKSMLNSVWKRACATVQDRSPLVQGLGIFVVLLILVILSAPIIGKAGAQAANRKWISEGVRIEAVVKEPEARERLDWYKNYKQCGSRRALDLIFSDKQSYYVLCISTVDKTSALVFEIRRDIGLVSVRFISRGN